MSYQGRMHRTPKGSYGALATKTQIRIDGMPRAALLGLACLVLATLAMVVSLPLGEALAAFGKIATIFQ